MEKDILTMDSLKQSLIKTLDDNVIEISSSKDREQLISEFVNGTVPIYHYNLLEVALSDLDLAIEVPEIYGFTGKHTAVNAIAGNIYAKLQEVANDWCANYEEMTK